MLLPLPLTLNNNIRHLSLIMVINCTKLWGSWSFRFSLYPAYNVSCHVFLLHVCDNTTLSFDLRPWKSKSIFLSSWKSILHQVVWSWNLWFILYPAISLCDNMTLTFNHRPWKTIGIILWLFWSNVPSFKILEQMIQSVSCLQCILSCFPTMWQYDLDLWPPTLKNNSF